jgi:DNA-binding transcriptional ArsR family regulator
VPASETGAIIPSTSASQLKSMFKELLDETKKDILSQVKDIIDQIYTDFESVALDLYRFWILWI